MQPALVASGPEATTHVLCASKPPLSGKQAASKLQGFAGWVAWVAALAGWQGGWASKALLASKISFPCTSFSIKLIKLYLHLSGLQLQPPVLL